MSSSNQNQGKQNLSQNQRNSRRSRSPEDNAPPLTTPSGNTRDSQRSRSPLPESSRGARLIQPIRTTSPAGMESRLRRDAPSRDPSSHDSSLRSKETVLPSNDLQNRTNPRPSPGQAQTHGMVNTMPAPPLRPKLAAEPQLFGETENFVLTTELLCFDRVGEAAVNYVSSTLDKFFGESQNLYTIERIERHIVKLTKAGWLPGRQIMLPGQYQLEELRSISSTWLDSKLRNETNGCRLHRIFLQHFGGKPGSKVFRDNGSVIRRPTEPSTGINIYRSIKYLDIWIERYGFYHWPSSLVERIEDLYSQEYDHESILGELTREKTDFCISDPNAIATCIWMAISKDQGQKTREQMVCEAEKFSYCMQAHELYAGRIGGHLDPRDIHSGSGSSK